MDVSLTKLLLLFWAFLAHGRPDGWDVAWQARLSLYLPGPAGSVSLVVDPVPIYYHPLPENLCGVYEGAVIVDPRAPEKGCAHTLEHELAHVWQARAYGLLQPLTYAISPSLWEPERPWEGAPPAPRVLEWALIRIWWPITP